MSKAIPWSQQYKHPNWQRKRLEAMEYHGFECRNCGDKETTLNVHHVRYVKGRAIWDYEVTELNVLCEPCHAEEHADRELLNFIAIEHGPGTFKKAACLLGGYLAVTNEIHPGVTEMTRQADSLYFEIGVTAGCMEQKGPVEWREMIGEHAKQYPKNLGLQALLEEMK